MAATSVSPTLRAASQRLVRALATVARGVHRRRAVLWALGARAIFWGALVLWCTTAMTLVGGGVLDTRDLLGRFVLGAAICGVVAVAATAARLRWLGALVGALHGTGGLVLWLLV